MDLSYEAMKKRNFSVWFFAIDEYRLDVLAKLLEYGIERYSEYRDFKGRDSYSVLIESFMEGRCPIGGRRDNTEKIIEILELFIAAGIPVDEKTITKSLFVMMSKYGRLVGILEYVAYIVAVLKKYDLWTCEEDISDTENIQSFLIDF